MGGSELMLVAGGSGMGKTAVINEIHKPIFRQQGLFIRGKFDQFDRNVPLSAFVQAFRDLIGQLLSDSDARLAQWQSRILTAVGENGRVLTVAIPELEQIIGIQPPVTELVGMAAQNRFNWLFQKFIEIFTQPAHPLTIFVDDLQWADAASRQLIKLLMESKGYLLVLGAYRDNEVSPLHPLMLMVSELQQAAKSVGTIELAPLQLQQIECSIADTLHCEISRSQPLAALIASKTQGNPLFIAQFLKALAADGELKFNPDGYWEWQSRIITPAGRRKWVRGESRQTTTTAGAIVWDGILLDVTEQQAALDERERAELALRQSEARYQQLADNIPGIIYQFRLAPDGSMTYPYISSGCEDPIHLTPAAVMTDAQCAIELIHPIDRLDLRQVLAASARDLTSILWEGRMVLPTGEIKWIKNASRPELQADGAIVWDGIMLDITARKQAEIELHQTNERLEATIEELQHAARLKDEFLATMSHELRTPLNAILGMSEALGEQLFGNLNPRQLSSIETIASSGEHLLSLINDLLDVAKIAAGKLELNITQTSLAELCKSSLILVGQQATNKQILLDSHLSIDGDPIAIDERRMRQVLLNLLPTDSPQFLTAEVTGSNLG